MTAHDLSQFESNHALPQPLGSLVLQPLPKPPEDKDQRREPSRPIAMAFLPQAEVIARIEQAGTALVLHPIKLSAGWDAKTHR